MQAENKDQVAGTWTTILGFICLMMVVTILGSIIGMMGGKITYGAGVGLVIVAGSIIVLSAIVTYMLSIILQI